MIPAIVVESRSEEGEGFLIRPITKTSALNQQLCSTWKALPQFSLSSPLILMQLHVKIGTFLYFFFEKDVKKGTFLLLIR